MGRTDAMGGTGNTRMGIATASKVVAMGLMVRKRREGQRARFNIS